jgi:hypothetical protein
MIHSSNYSDRVPRENSSPDIVCLPFVIVSVVADVVEIMVVDEVRAGKGERVISFCKIG